MTATTGGLVDLQVNGFAGVDFNTPGLTAEAQWPQVMPGTENSCSFMVCSSQIVGVERDPP